MNTSAETKIESANAEIRKALPEIDLINDEKLREQVIGVWEDALTDGGWTIEQLYQMPFSIHVENCPISFIEHVRTVCKMCIAVTDVLKESYGDRTELDKDDLVAGALLADVGKLIEYELKGGKYVKARRGEHLRHPFIAVAMSHARGISTGVQHIIATHSKEGDIMTRSNESVIFHHADFIDFDLVSKKRPF